MKFKLFILGLAGLSALCAQPRFDFLVRNDFFAGFGDMAHDFRELLIGFAQRQFFHRSSPALVAQEM